MTPENPQHGPFWRIGILVTAHCRSADRYSAVRRQRAIRRSRNRRRIQSCVALLEQLNELRRAPTWPL